MADIGKAQQALKNEDLLQCDKNALQYARKPLGKAIVRGRGRPRKSEYEKAKPNDRVICKKCGKEYTRANKPKHDKTKIHRLYDKLEEKFRLYIIND